MIRKMENSDKEEPFDRKTTSPPIPLNSHDPRLSLRDPLPAPAVPPELQHTPPVQFESEPQTLSAFRANEGSAKRLQRLKHLFESIPLPDHEHYHPSTSTLDSRNDEPGKEDLKSQYAHELYKKCSGCSPSSSTILDDKAETAVRWTEFEKYAEEKEKELWRLFVELDVDGDMRLRQGEVKEACKRAGVVLKDGELGQFIDAVGGDG